MAYLHRLSGLTWPFAAIGIALVLGALLMGLAGFNPVVAYAEMLHGIFGSVRNFGEVLLKATPVILIGSGLAVSFRTGVWNIGAEGQFYMGGVATAYVALQMDGVPPLVAIPLILAAGALAGALWAGIAGLCRAWAGTSEIVTTIMLNYAAIIFTSYLVTGPLKEAQGLSPQSDRFPRSTLLPQLWEGTRLNIGILIAIAAAILSWYLISQTSRGFAMRTVGASPEAARYAGIDVGKNIVYAICYSGALAGLAGSVELLGVTKRLYQTISPGYGFEGIAVSLLANNNPLGAIFSGTLFGALRSGSEVMQMGAGVPSVLVFIVQGLVIVCLVALAALRLRKRLATD
jgi:simple sugar transport system permease protein